jgi:Fur family peroxide stress response transcriptional regulator
LFKSLEDIRQGIMEAGLKSTHQRVMILDAMMKMNIHPTADDIYQVIRKKNPSISLGTVYKNLETLAEKGLIRKVSSEEGQMRYDAENKPHHHIHCRNSSEIIDYHDEELDAMIRDYLRRKQIDNFEIDEVSLQISGNKLKKNKNVSIQ